MIPGTASSSCTMRLHLPAGGSHMSLDGTVTDRLIFASPTPRCYYTALQVLAIGVDAIMISELQAKLLGDMAPGELVRFPFRRWMPLGIVACCDVHQSPAGIVIFLLEDLPDRPGTSTRYIPVLDFLISEVGLSYGKSCDVVVHPAAPVVAAGHQGFSIDGALLVGGGVRALRSQPELESFSGATILIDADKWAAIPRSLHEPKRVAILAWELRLQRDGRIDQLAPPVFTFAANR
jgi:hypothetical protein